MSRWLAIAASAILATLIGVTEAPCAEPAADFLRDVKPILSQRCFRCHSSLEQESNLRLDSATAILKGGDGGAVIVPGKSNESRLIAAVERRGELKMPPAGQPLDETQIAVLRAWIDAGAPAPLAGAEARVAHWSFQKPQRPAIPEVADPAWAANPIDAFIAAKHAELDLTPVGLAPPNLLLRRVYLDLVGLPPTTEELEDFLSAPGSHSLSGSPADANDGATERPREGEKEQYDAVVDKLLASPHYGERWGRHWMDVWRYSDWDGYNKEVRESQPHIWRWRDWIVESLNANKSYDRMVQEMLAGDELAPDDPDILRATGYLVRSWYKFNRNKWLDDAIEHTGKAFLGVTFNCCRCHDHMYDPLAQREYYSLRAFFEPYEVRTDRVPDEADITKNGLVRVFDAKADAKTFLFVRGNEKNPLEDQPLAPVVPKLFELVPCSIVPVKLPQIAAYPGLADFVREETLAAANKELATAQSALATAERKFADAVSHAEQTPLNLELRAPSPPTLVGDADAQLALARAAFVAAEAHVAFNTARVRADEASYSDPPADKAHELSLAATQAERAFNLRQAQKAVVQTEINLTTAEKAKKRNDAKTAKAVTDAEMAISAARKAQADASDALDQLPTENYTHFTPIYPATSTGRRLALARWITSKENPLAARVAINHIWLRHFATPLVPTVFDFGMNGKPPANQPLLDWLAIELMENGWQLKHIHRLIVTSRTYRLASTAAQQVQGSADPENVYYWRANPRRMEAEIVRDATLYVGGSLDETAGGPELDQAAGLTNPRRSLYFRSSKEKKVQFLAMFDSPNPVECYRRSESIAPQQALAIANSTLTLAQARILAKKLSDSVGNFPTEEATQKFVKAAFFRILCRQPTEKEKQACVEFLAEQTTQLADSKSLTAFSSGPAASVPPSADPQQRAREDLVHVLFNHNDFVTVR